MKRPGDTNQTAYIERRIERIPECGCWIWTGSTFTNGYGRAVWDYRTYRAHRFSWLTHVGTIKDDLCVLHRCDIPLCVNPAHLWLGPSLENNEDRDKKGRVASGVRWTPRNTNAPRGAAHKLAKLTDEMVRAIRLDTAPQTVIGARFGIKQATVSDIKRGKRWAHVT